MQNVIIYKDTQVMVPQYMHKEMLKKTDTRKPFCYRIKYTYGLRSTILARDEKGHTRKLSCPWPLCPIRYDSTKRIDEISTDTHRALTDSQEICQLQGLKQPSNCVSFLPLDWGRQAGRRRQKPTSHDMMFQQSVILITINSS